MEENKNSKPDLNTELLSRIETDLIYMDTKLTDIRDMMRNQTWKWSLAAFAASMVALILTLTR